MNKVVLSLGSNSDDCRSRVDDCFNWLSTILSDLRKSHVYETPAVNGKDSDYLNAVVIGDIKSDYDTVYQLMKEYERKNGRTVESKIEGIVPIDIDIVVWNNKILREKDFFQSYFQIGWNMLNQ